jgi:uracil-DNA glycosylase
MATKLNWELFKPLFGTYSERFKGFFDDGGFDKIYERLKFDSLRGKSIAPLSSQVFRCFQETPIDNVKVIMCGYAPYHTFYNNMPVADGLLMSCSNTKKLQPSLEKFYNSMEKDLCNGLGLNMIREPDLTYLAKEGILMLNASLSTEKGKPGSHSEIWEPFMKFLFEEVLLTNGIPVVFLGREAAKLKRYVFPFTWIFELTHPAAAAYSSGDWNSENVFKDVNRILKDNNGDTISWFKTE